MKQDEIDKLILDGREYLEYLRDAFPDEEEIIKALENSQIALEQMKGSSYVVSADNKS